MLSLIRPNVLVLFLLVAVAGCGKQVVSDGEPVSILWESGEQFIRMERPTQKEFQGENQHPVTYNEKTLNKIFRNLISEDSAWFRLGRSAQQAIFTPNMSALLSKHVAEGLSRSESSQDITFVLHGVKRAGLIKKPYGVGGRIFVQDGILHLILGSVFTDITDREGGGRGRTLDEAKPSTYRIFVGSRQRSIGTGGYKIKAAEGVSTKAKRQDWIQIDVETAASAFSKIERDTNIFSDKTSPEVRQEAMQALLEEQRQQQMLEMAKFRKETQGKPLSATQLDSKSVQERLQTLKDLRDEGLITTEEFQRKREEIISSL